MSLRAKRLIVLGTILVALMLGLLSYLQAIKGTDDVGHFVYFIVLVFSMLTAILLAPYAAKLMGWGDE